MNRLFVSLFVVMFLAAPADVLADQAPKEAAGENPAAAEDSPEKELVRLIELKKTTGLPASRSRIVTPVVIKTQEELEKLTSDKDLLAKLAEEVDFATDHLLYFAWGGSGRDTITTEVTETEGKPPHVDFHYKQGLTRDLRPHRLLYVIKQEASWKVDNVR